MSMCIDVCQENSSAAVRNDCDAFDYALGDEARGDKAILLSAVSQVRDWR